MRRAREAWTSTTSPAACSFFFAAWSELFEEVAKFRAARRMWARIMRDRFGARNPRSMMCRFHVQTAGSSLTAQSVDNNVVRTTIQALSAVLGGTQSLHTNARDEALALPTEESARLALRTQQIIAYEAGVTETPDPLAGSYYVETLTNQLEAAAQDYLDQIEAMGGTLAAIDSGFQQHQIQEAAYRVQREVESGERIVVGVNGFTDDETVSPRLQRIDPQAELDQAARVRRVRAERDPEAWRRAMDALDARGRVNGEPGAGDHRRGEGPRHARRDQRPPAGGVRRAPRADHGLMEREQLVRYDRDVDAARVDPHARPGPSRGRRGPRRRRLVGLLAGHAGAARGDGAAHSVGPASRIAFLPVGESKIELRAADR